MMIDSNGGHVRSDMNEGKNEGVYRQCIDFNVLWIGQSGDYPTNSRSLIFRVNVKALLYVSLNHTVKACSARLGEVECPIRSALVNAQPPVLGAGPKAKA